MNKLTKLSSIITLFFILIILNNCGGGGGGGGATGSSTNFVTTEYNQQYGLASIKASAAYDRGYNGTGIKVAVLDGGFDTGHTDLDGNFITGYDEEDDNNTPNAASHTAAMGGHGTHVAGIIAAEKNDSGMHGVAYKASIIPVKIFKDSGVSMSDISNSVAYAADNGAIAINNSWGTATWTSRATCGGITCYGYIPGTSSSGFNGTNERTEWDDVATANAVAVFAAGNEGNNSATGQMNFYSTTSTNSTLRGTYSSTVVKNAGLISYVNRSSYEARFGLIDSDVSENWLNVVSVNSSNVISSFSNGCGDTKAYCIAAPGEDIYSTEPTALTSGGFGTKSGTSMAAPHVSAAIAILKHEYPNLTGAEIVDLLLSSATDLGASGTDDVYGVGLLNLNAATTPSGIMVLAQTDSDNNLDKFDLSSTGINFSSIFNNQIITNQNFIGVVDDYNRVYSHNMKDYTSFTEREKSVLDNIIFNTKDVKFSSTKIDKFNTAIFFERDNSSLIKYENLKFQNHQNPYNKILKQSDQFHTFYNSKIRSDLTIFDNQISNYNFIYTSNLIKKNNTNLKLGLMNEGNTFLGTKGSGLFESKGNTKTYFIDYKNDIKIKSKNLLIDFTLGQTLVDFKKSKYIDNSKITTAAYSLGLQSSFNKIKVKNFIGFNQPLSIVDGSLNIKTISGYGAEGDYVNRDQQINLSNHELNFITSTTKFLNKNSLIKFNTNINNNNSNLAGLYVFNF